MRREQRDNVQCAESARLRGGRFPAPRVRANEAIHPLQCAAGIRRASALAARSRPLTRALTLRSPAHPSLTLPARRARHQNVVFSVWPDVYVKLRKVRLPFAAPAGAGGSAAHAGCAAAAASSAARVSAAPRSGTVATRP